MFTSTVPVFGTCMPSTGCKTSCLVTLSIFPYVHPSCGLIDPLDSETVETGVER